MGAGLRVVHVGAEVTHGAYSGVQVGALPGVYHGELDRHAKATPVNVFASWCELWTLLQEANSTI